jgi:hypothetical protein
MRVFQRTSRRRGTRGSLALLTALSIGAASCSDQTTGPGGPSVPGKPHFTQTPPPPQALSWIAPLGTAIGDPVSFDAGVAPRIEICVWVTGACSGSPIAIFTNVTVNTAAARYEATWSLMSTTFTTRKTYRIRVLKTDAGGVTETGAISVDVVRGRWALTRSDGTQAPLVSATQLPINFHIAKLNCVNTSSCAAQVVPPTIPTGTKVTVKTNDGNHWVTFQGDANGKWNTQGIPAVVTVEDVSAQLGGTPSACEQGITKMVVQGHCIRITTEPAIILAAPAVVCMTLESFSHDWQLVKYDPGQPPLVKFLADPPALACPQTGGHDGDGGGGGANPIRRVASLIGRALMNFVTPKNAYAFDLGVGGSIEPGDSFSFFAPGLPARLQIVSGDNVTGIAGSALGSPQVVRVMNTHHNTPIGGAIVTCAVTAGAGTLPSSDFPGRATENPTGTYTCPTWTLGATPGANTLKVTANIIDDFITGGAVSFTAAACETDCLTPNLAFKETKQTGEGSLFDEYDFTVTNRASFPASLFAPRPGATTCISQTRVDFYDASTNQYIYGFCGLGSPSDLDNIWFAVPRWTQPPAGVYLKFIDQTTNAVLFTSNTVQLFGPDFHNFPRTIELDWAPILNAATYTVQVDYCESWAADWRNCNAAWIPLQTATVQAPTTSFVHTFVGDQPGRWRVTALSVTGAPLGTTDYKFFIFHTPPGP